MNEKIEALGCTQKHKELLQSVYKFMVDGIENETGGFGQYKPFKAQEMCHVFNVDRSTYCKLLRELVDMGLLCRNRSRNATYTLPEYNSPASDSLYDSNDELVDDMGHIAGGTTDAVGGTTDAAGGTTDAVGGTTDASVAPVEIEASDDIVERLDFQVSNLTNRIGKIDFDLNTRLKTLNTVICSINDDVTKRIDNIAVDMKEQLVIAVDMKEQLVPHIQENHVKLWETIGELTDNVNELQKYVDDQKAVAEIEATEKERLKLVNVLHVYEQS